MEVKLQNTRLLPATQKILSDGMLQEEQNKDMILGNIQSVASPISLEPHKQSMNLPKQENNQTTKQFDLTKKSNLVMGVDRLAILDKCNKLSENKAKLIKTTLAQKDLHLLLNNLFIKSSKFITNTYHKSTDQNSNQQKNLIETKLAPVNTDNKANMSEILELIVNNKNNPESNMLLLSMLMQEHQNIEKEDGVDSLILSMFADIPLFANVLPKDVDNSKGNLLNNITAKLSALYGKFTNVTNSHDRDECINNINNFMSTSSDAPVDEAQSPKQQLDLISLAKHRDMLVALKDLNSIDVVNTSPTIKVKDIDNALLVVNVMMYMIQTMGANATILAESLHVLSGIVADLNSTNQLLSDQKSAYAVNNQASFEHLDAQTYQDIHQKIIDAKNSFWFSIITSLVMDIINIVQSIIELNPLLLITSLLSTTNDIYKLAYIATVDPNDIDFQVLQAGFWGNTMQTFLIIFTFVSTLGKSFEELEIMFKALKVKDAAKASIALSLALKIATISYDGVVTGFDVANKFGYNVSDSVGSDAGMFLQNGIVAGIVNEITVMVNKILGEKNSHIIWYESIVAAIGSVLCCVGSAYISFKISNQIMGYKSSLGTEFMTTQEEIMYDLVSKLEVDNINLLKQKVISNQNMGITEHNQSVSQEEQISANTNYTDKEKIVMLTQEIKFNPISLASATNSKLLTMYCSSYRWMSYLQISQILNSIVMQSSNIADNFKSADNSDNINRDIKDKEVLRVKFAAISQYLKIVQKELIQNIDAIYSLIPRELSDVSDLLQMRNDILSGWGDV